ncbi:hypothetical protein J8I87_28580 [Paraburkholderia sp. LEh10]|uniref:hypothetical protein n=1 Tax=Paraburkholderia sp. LEh10 TaxID=2821353 RepID=UPI001AE7A5C0|nr:hypothetical protein [Paraburkholderia sp. LEh10]MBP0593579.1 hypothetical protein [Paraburkholderia sp. LEh10]
MSGRFLYHGFIIDVRVQTDWRTESGLADREGYIAIVKILQAGSRVELFPPLRFGNTEGRPFSRKACAMMAGYKCRTADG